jgi:hypothetical protein
MTARQVDPESRRRPAYAAVALVLMMAAVLLAAGCIEPGYTANHDIVVIKLSPNGSLEWSKIIDKGGDDQADVIIPISDGGSIISANFDSLIRFSRDGTIVWEKDFRDPICFGNALAQLQDGSFVVGSSGNGLVCKVDEDGNPLWNKSSVKTDSVTTSSIHSIVETKDGGFLVAGNYLTKLDADGRPIWQQSYATHDGIQGYEETFSVIEMKNRQEFLGLSRKYNELYLIHIDRNGTIIADSSLGMYDGYPSPSIKTDTNGYSILFVNTTNSSVVTVHLDAEGKIKNQKILMGATIPTIMTNDGGYLSAIIQNPEDHPNTPSENREISVGGKKIDADGKEIWKLTPLTFCKPAKTTTNIQIKNVVQTSDNGYVILGLRDNFWKC